MLQVHSYFLITKNRFKFIINDLVWNQMTGIRPLARRGVKGVCVWRDVIHCRTRMLCLVRQCHTRQHALYVQFMWLSTYITGPGSVSLNLLYLFPYSVVASWTFCHCEMASPEQHGVQNQRGNRARTVTGNVDTVSLLRCVEAKLSDCHQLVCDALYASATMSETEIPRPLLQSDSSLQEQHTDRDTKLQDVQNTACESCCENALVVNDSEDDGTQHFGLCKCFLIKYEGRWVIFE